MACSFPTAPPTGTEDLRPATVGRHQLHRPGLYGHGPLLAGNVVGANAIWHVEHCGRIISLSDRIAERIHSELKTQSRLKPHDTRVAG